MREKIGELKSASLMSDWDILTKILKYSDEEANEILDGLKIKLKKEIVKEANKFSDCNFTIDDNITIEAIQDTDDDWVW